LVLFTQVKNPGLLGAEKALPARFRCEISPSGSQTALAPFFENLEFQQLIAAPFRPKHTNNPFTSKEINSPQWISIVPRKI
jgi:hypothetical protein